MSTFVERSMSMGSRVDDRSNCFVTDRRPPLRVGCVSYPYKCLTLGARSWRAARGVSIAARAVAVARAAASH